VVFISPPSPDATRKEKGGRVCMNHRGNVETGKEWEVGAERGKMISTKSVTLPKRAMARGACLQGEEGTRGKAGYLQMNARYAQGRLGKTTKIKGLIEKSIFFVLCAKVSLTCDEEAYVL